MRRREGLLVLSDSMLEVHRHCSTKFWFQYLEKPIVESRIPAFEFGSLVHKMFEEFFIRYDPTKKMYTSAEHFANVFVGRWMGIDYKPKDPNAKKAKLGDLVFRDIEFTDPVTGQPKRINEKMLYMGLGKSMCKRFFEDNQKTPPSHILLEYHFETIVGPDPVSNRSFVVQGYIDRIELRNSSEPPVYLKDANGELVLTEDGKPQFDYNPATMGSAIKRATDGELLCVDYKTGKHAPSQAALDNDTQFSTYDMALEREFPNITKRAFAIWNVRDGAVIETTRNEVDRVELIKRIYEEGHGMEEETYRFLGDMYVCERCPFMKPCGSLREWSKQQNIDPELIMRKAAPVVVGRSRKLITWREGVIAQVNTDAMLGDEKVFGYVVRSKPEAPSDVSPITLVDEVMPAPVQPPVLGRRRKKAEQLSLLG